jgi:dihydrofolate reductase
MGKLVLYIAVSLDGYIATPDGGVGWLDDFNIEGEDYGYAEFFERLGTLIMGGKTYRQGLTFGEWPYGSVTTYVVTRQAEIERPDAPIVAYSGDFAELVEQIRREDERDIWLVGGGELNAEFLRAGLIDEYIVSVIPVLLGDGIPLVSGVQRSVDLMLTDSNVYPNGVVQLRYIKKP